MKKGIRLALLAALALAARAHEEVVCPGFDVRNDPAFVFLENLDNSAGKENNIYNCTVVEGNVRIILITNGNVTNDQFKPLPRIREITGSLLVFQIKGLKSVGTILPNLRVIGGRELISNYAFVVFQNQDLEEIALPHLREIRRGGVRIQENEMLCGAENTNWSVITRGDSLLRSRPTSAVPVDIVIRGNGDPNKCNAQCRPAPGHEQWWKDHCEVNYFQKESLGKHALLVPESKKFACYTPTSCQIKCSEACGRTSAGKTLGGCTDLDPRECCHPECAGGCKKGGRPDTCFACRHIYHKGVCIPECPQGLFLIQNRRCITRQQCLDLAPRPHYVRSHGVFKPLSFPNQTAVCTTKCPQDYMEDPKNMKTCIRCPGPCKIHCPTHSSEPIISIQGLEDLKDCQVVEGNLTLQITGLKENLGMTLEECLGEIMEIEGYLSITSNPLITSLSFFKKLEKIGGGGLFKGKYALAINENENLRMLFPPHHPKLLVGNGTHTPAIHVHNNPMLCYSHILETARNNSWIGKTEELDPDDVSKTSNGDKTVCVNSEMALYVTVDADTAILSWDSFNDSDIDHRNFLGYKLYYKELGEDEEPDMFRGNDGCSDTWNKRFLGNEARGDVINPLTPNTRVAFYIKTSVSHHQGAKGAISKIIVVRTLFQTPSAPRILNVVQKEDSIQVNFLPPKYPFGQVTHYRVIYTQIPHKIPMNRDYCMEKPKREEAEAGAGSAEAGARNETAEEGTCAAVDKGCCPAPAPDAADTKDSGDHDVIIVDPTVRADDINFENAIHNHVFEHVCDNGRPSSTQLDCRFKPQQRGDTESSRNGIMDEKRKKRSIPPPTEPAKFPGNQTNQTQTEPLPHFVNVTKTAVLLTNLPHYTQFRIEIFACQNVSVPVHYCSEKSLNLLATSLPIKEMDAVEKIWWAKDWQKAGENETQTSVEGSHTALIKWIPPSQPNGPILNYQIRTFRVDSREGAGGSDCVSRQKFLADGGFILAGRAAGNYSVEVAVGSLGGTGPWSPKLYVQVGEQSPFSPLFIGLMVAGAALIIAVVAFVAATLAKKHFIKQMPNYIVQFVSSNMDYIQTAEVYTKDEWELKREDVELREELGSGTFGKVYLGEGQVAGSGARIRSQNGVEFGPCAVKMVKEGGSPMERLHFLLEANVMKQFNTQFIVKLLGVVSEEQPTLVVMELMGKGNLRDYLRSRRPGAEENVDDLPAPSLTECLQWALMIADGMAYLEARKFVHRDLAARNIMVGEDDVVKIGDFGMARDVYVTDYYRPEGVRKMPVRHMSPESLIDHKFTSKSDVWAYGVVLWEVATQGQQPYMGLGPEEILPFVGRDKKTMHQPTGCPNELYDLMKMCWAYDRRHRPSFFGLLNYILRHTTLRPAFRDYMEKVSFFCSAEGGGGIDGSATEDDGAVEDEDGVIGSYTSDAVDSDTPLNTAPGPAVPADSSPPVCASNRRPGSSPSWHRPPPPSPPTLTPLPHPSPSPLSPTPLPHPSPSPL